MRADYNVPLENGRITDDYRIKASLPTLNYLLEHNARIIICSHLGRPDGKPNQVESLEPAAKRLGELLPNVLVSFASRKSFTAWVDLGARESSISSRGRSK
jgi:3-phosphoglycerate kinase